jgi:hypothetical protein
LLPCAKAREEEENCYFGDF